MPLTSSRLFANQVFTRLDAGIQSAQSVAGNTQKCYKAELIVVKRKSLISPQLLLGLPDIPGGIKEQIIFPFLRFFNQGFHMLGRPATFAGRGF